MQPEVVLYESVSYRRWHTVLIVVPSGDESRTVLREIVDKVGKAIGIKKRWNRLIVKRGGVLQRDHRGYIRVYEGEGTPEDHKRFKRAQKLAEKLVAAIPPDAIKPWKLSPCGWEASMVAQYPYFRF